MCDKVPLERVIARLREGKRFLVIGHVRPDGDAIGSVAALVLILRRLGKVAEGCIADRIPWFYRGLAGVDAIRTPEELRDFSFDTAVVVDSSDITRIGGAAELLRGKRPDINLDHHVTNTGFAELNHCDPSAAATAALVHEIGRRLVPLDPDIAEALLLGLATDTGFFKYSTVDRRVFLQAAELVGAGADIQRIATAVLEHRTLEEIKLLVEMFGTLHVEEGGRLAWAFVSAEMLRRHRCSSECTEGFVGEIRAIHGVEIAILFTEWPPGEVHVSLRSKGQVDVSRIALRFGGGGHPRAAGCSFQGVPLEEAIGRVVAASREALKALP